jgi:23S rRNA (adenine2503-C2)-methyltransferase
VSNIYDLTRKEFQNIVTQNGLNKFQGDQIFSFIYRNKVRKLEECFNVNKKALSLFNDYDFETLNIDKVEKDSLGNIKFLFRLKDNNLIESVVMNQSYGKSICITTQVGCNMGCKFCASGKLKKIRDLTPGEMVLQVIKAEEYLNDKLSYVVCMGIGEPFDNYLNLTKFLYIINDPKGISLGARHITVSTCGIPSKIIEFADLDLQVNLAISLHATTNPLRTSIMPINKVYNLDELFKAISIYLTKGRRVTIEYILLKGVNDRETDANRLLGLLKHLDCYVNLIPYNDADTTFQKPNHDEQMRFYKYLRDAGLNVTLRKEMGSNISAACGQLRGNNLA